MGSREIRFTKEYFINIWSTSGGGTRFEYRSYNDLSIIKTITSYYSFEDFEDDILINPDSTFRKIEFYNYSNGTEIKIVDYRGELWKKKGISTNYADFNEIKKTDIENINLM